jgi:hypothetical protein
MNIWKSAFSTRLISVMNIFLSKYKNQISIGGIFMTISYIKLYGPSIFQAQEALEKMIKDITPTLEIGNIIKHMVSIIEPTLDLATGEMLGRGDFTLGEYDFAIEWKDNPTKDQVKTLIRRIDTALMFTGCRYAITTKHS